MDGSAVKTACSTKAMIWVPIVNTHLNMDSHIPVMSALGRGQQHEDHRGTLPTASLVAASVGDLVSAELRQKVMEQNLYIFFWNVWTQEDVSIYTCERALQTHKKQVNKKQDTILWKSSKDKVLNSRVWDVAETLTRWRKMEMMI